MNRISEIRDRENIKQGELADALGWSRSRISNYEAARRQPSLSDSRAITVALNKLGAKCTLDEVFPPAADELVLDRRSAERRTTERRQAERRA